MIKIPENLPVPYSKTMEIADSSKVQAFQDCPRGFFFSYVLGLRPAGPNIHLDFGSAWHDAMETIFLNPGNPNLLNMAYEAFLKTFREAFPEEITDADKAPKNPEYAYKALKIYLKQYEKDNFNVLYTETAGLIPISEERSMVVKLDSIVEDIVEGKVNSLEHKTTGRNSSAWRDKWQMMLQISAYTHLLYSMFPEEKVGKVIVNGAVFTKTKIFEGVRLPIYKSKQQMVAFLWEVNHWIDMIEWNYQELAKCKPSDPVMTAFPINCSSCSKYGCRMGGICTAFPNPLRFAETPPAGYVVDFWDPLRRNIQKSDNVIMTDEDGHLSIKKKEDAGLDPEFLEPLPAREGDNDDFSMFTL